MDPNQTVDVAPAPQAQVSLDDMVASLAPGEGEGTSAVGEDPAPAAEEAVQTAETAEDEGEEAEEAPKSESEAKPDPKKPSRNQRLKAARDSALAEVVAEKKNAAQALSVANYWRTEAHARDALLRHVLKETNFQLDQRDLALLDVRRENTRKEFEAQTQAELQKIEQTHAETVQRRALADDFSTQAHSLAKKTGVPPVQILQAYAMAEQQGFGLSMDQVAQQLSAVARKGGPARAPSATSAPAAQQLAANRSAPRPVRGGRVPAPAFDASLEGMTSFLESLPTKVR